MVNKKYDWDREHCPICGKTDTIEVGAWLDDGTKIHRCYDNLGGCGSKFRESGVNFKTRKTQFRLMLGKGYK
jgi:hypothetical protein